ncbi:MAG TPA: hypothetical protein VKR32_02545 [Puia sp.]|nr:hypothetical protein [Puia sp.]
MKFSVFSMILCLIALIYCFAFVAMPVTTMEQYGMHLDASGASIARLFGGALLGFAVAFWIIRNQSPESIAVKSVLWATLISQLVYLIVGLNGILNNLVNSLGWSSIVLHVLIILVCIYFLRAKKEGAKTA